MPPPRPAPPRLSWWSEAWRIALASVFGLALWFVPFIDDVPQGSWLPVVDLILGVGAIVAMHWRRRWPVAVAVGTTLVTAVSGVAGVASVIAFVSLVTTRRWRAIAVTVVIGCAATSTYGQLSADEAGLPWWTTPVVSLVGYGFAVLFGLYVGARRELVSSYRERAETAEREQAVRVEQARLSERARIAREMHDVLAHRISLLSLHAGAMTFRTDLSPDELRASARVVQDNAHQAMLDLRDVLGVLRDPAAADPEAAALAPDRPQPTLADLPTLVQEARQTGTEVHLRGDVLDGPAPPDTVGRTAYRIVQEALTNARKHAPGAPVSLRLTGRPGARLEIEVSNPTRLPVGAPETGAGGRVPGSGLGLVGLTERAVLAGGGLQHGPTLGGDYRIQAWLPWPA
jgi:signal transduction histidine kinase